MKDQGELSPAERGLLAALREGERRAFSMTVSQSMGVWTVKRVDVRSSSSVEYQGANFEAAWNGAARGHDESPTLRMIEGGRIDS